MPLDWVWRLHALNPVDDFPEEADGDKLKEKDEKCSDGQKSCVGTKDVESDLEGAPVHGEDTAVEEQDGKFDQPETKGLEKGERIGRLDNK